MMRNRLCHVLALVTLTACSPPRYTYYFDRYSTKEKNPPVPGEVLAVAIPAELTVSSATTWNGTLPRSGEKNRVTPIRTSAQLREVVDKAQGTKAIPAAYAPESPAATSLDKDLKFSLIFGPSGIVFLIIGGSAFIVLGSICLIIGLIFFLKWILRQ